LAVARAAFDRAFAINPLLQQTYGADRARAAGQ
jgi:hypothetical protein